MHAVSNRTSYDEIATKRQGREKKRRRKKWTKRTKTESSEAIISTEIFNVFNYFCVYATLSAEYVFSAAIFIYLYFRFLFSIFALVRCCRARYGSSLRFAGRLFIAAFRNNINPHNSVCTERCLTFDKSPQHKIHAPICVHAVYVWARVTRLLNLYNNRFLFGNRRELVTFTAPKLDTRKFKHKSNEQIFYWFWTNSRCCCRSAAPICSTSHTLSLWVCVQFSRFYCFYQDNKKRKKKIEPPVLSS